VGRFGLRRSLATLGLVVAGALVLTGCSSGATATAATGSGFGGLSGVATGPGHKVRHRVRLEALHHYGVTTGHTHHRAPSTRHRSSSPSQGSHRQRKTKAVSGSPRSGSSGQHGK